MTDLNIIATLQSLYAEEGLNSADEGTGYSVAGMAALYGVSEDITFDCLKQFYPVEYCLRCIEWARINVEYDAAARLTLEKLIAKHG